ncbi:hypothetical protein B0A49_05674 [Cryomyces minteri]|uniref:Uncharacterized protein n=1 Tax=Cryomyces minteri TaxID=331657 RepID=A0A4U0WW44_9PEZI|nr:hypothetical protein B0A49_05449 [Cryomyces minteri]TKA67924.1 hypothetical protein B0A49_05674 [Cryomyces minteri]
MVGWHSNKYQTTSSVPSARGPLTVLVVLGEVANFAAYAFAPAILVTPLGALSVLIGAVLGSYFLKEKLGTLGKLGCAICLIGSVVIVLHAPPDKEVQTIDEILNFAIQPGFVFYCLLVTVFSVVMIYRVAPRTVGSVSIMAVKAFGIALKLTFGGNNQFTHPSTYVFMIVVVVCILTQMNYFNKALSQFSTNIVNPLYYVTFTTCTLVASFILFKGFNTSDAVNTISLLCGFLVIFTGVYLLNLSRDDPEGANIRGGPESIDPDDPQAHFKYSMDNGIPTDGLTGLQTRRSMQARRSIEDHRRRGSGGTSYRGDREHLMHSYDAEAAAGFGLAELAEDSDEDTSGKRTSFDKGINGHGSGPGALRSTQAPTRSGSGRVEVEHQRPSKSSDLFV